MTDTKVDTDQTIGVSTLPSESSVSYPPSFLHAYLRAGNSVPYQVNDRTFSPKSRKIIF